VTVVEDRPNYNVRKILSPSFSLPVLAKANAPCRAVSPRQLTMLDFMTRNSPGDEIANVNFLCDHIVHALKIQ